MDIAELTVMRALARTPNLSHAATILKTSQPRLSQQLARLEKELGVRLFDRTSRGLRINASGEIFSPFAAQIVAAHTEALKALKAVTIKEHQELRVGVVHTSSPSCPSRLLKQMRTRHPSMRVVVTKASLPVLIHELQDGDLDALLCYDPQKYGSFEWQPLFTTRLSGFSRSSPSIPHEQSAADFAKRSLILPSTRCEVRAILDKEFKRQQICPTIVAEVDDIALIRSSVKAGDASTILPESTLHSIKGLVRTRLNDPIMILTAGIIHKAKPVRPVRLLVKALTEGRTL